MASELLTRLRSRRLLSGNVKEESLPWLALDLHRAAASAAAAASTAPTAADGPPPQCNGSRMQGGGNVEGQGTGGAHGSGGSDGGGVVSELLGVLAVAMVEARRGGRLRMDPAVIGALLEAYADRWGYFMCGSRSTLHGSAPGVQANSQQPTHKHSLSCQGPPPCPDRSRSHASLANRQPLLSALTVLVRTCLPACATPLPPTPFQGALIRPPTGGGGHCFPRLGGLSAAARTRVPCSTSGPPKRAAPPRPRRCIRRPLSCR